LLSSFRILLSTIFLMNSSARIALEADEAARKRLAETTRARPLVLSGSTVPERLQRLRVLIDQMEPELFAWANGQGRREEALRAALAVSQDLQAIINALRSAATSRR
jgi:hypothetical protein